MMCLYPHYSSVGCVIVHYSKLNVEPKICISFVKYPHSTHHFCIMQKLLLQI